MNTLYKIPPGTPLRVKLLHDHQYNTLIKEGSVFIYDKTMDKYKSWDNKYPNVRFERTMVIQYLNVIFKEF